MIFNHRWSIIVILFMLVGLFAVCSLAGAQTISHLKLDTHQIPWSHLSFRAKNFWVEVSTDIQMKTLPASDLDAVLLTSPKGTPIKPQTSQINEMTINTIIEPRFRPPVKIHNRIWFNPTDASALGRIRLRRGEDDFIKTYRFTEQGVFRHRIEPKNKKEASLELEQWTDVKDSFYPYDKAGLGCSGVTERSLLIYLISAMAVVKNSDPLSLCVFGKRQLHRVTLQHADLVPIKANYIEKKNKTEKHQQKMITARKINLSSEPMESDLTEAENFSFLGFHKEISIYIDPASGIPIRASGIIPSAGRAELNLNRVWLKK